jgi:GNAT superfamily N-acetyltransferase
MLHVRDSSHVSMLFVERRRQGAGIARALFETALTRFVLVGPLTVNSSPNAAGFYARVGFRATGPEEIKNGIRFVPMRRDFPCLAAADRAP